jgi:signal transduction histidine kinase
VILFFCCSVVPLVVVAVAGHVSANRLIVAAVRRQAAFSSAQFEQRFTRELNRRRDLLALTARGIGTLPDGWSARVRLRGNEVEFYVDDLLEVDLAETFTRLVLLDLDGRPAVGIDYQSWPRARGRRLLYHAQTTGFQPEDRRGYELALGLSQREQRVLGPQTESGTMTLRLIAPLFADGQRLGVLLGDVDAGPLIESLIGEMSLGKDVSHFVFDRRSHVLLSHPDFSKRNQLLELAMPRLAGRLATEPDGRWLRYREDDGGEWVVARRALPDTPWVCAIVAPLDDLLAPLRRVSVVSLVVVLVALVGASLVIVLLTRHFRRSLAELTTAAERFSSGDLSARTDIRSDDELGALGATFNRTVSALGREIERREQDAKVESFNRLSAAVAHDLKSSLFSLTLLVDNLDRHLGDRDFLRDCAQTLRGTVDKMKRTSDKLTTRHPGELRREPVKLAPVLRQIVRAVGVEGSEKVDVQLELAEDLVVVGDPSEIERLFTNLAQNAVEAMPDGGRLRIAARRTDGERGPLARVVVEDSGVGMTREFVERELFRPFVSTKDRGIGLGLYACREIVRRHGGEITVVSEPEQGTRFFVDLPAVADRPENGLLGALT